MALPLLPPPPSQVYIPISFTYFSSCLLLFIIIYVCFLGAFVAVLLTSADGNGCRRGSELLGAFDRAQDEWGVRKRERERESKEDDCRIISAKFVESKE